MTGVVKVVGGLAVSLVGFLTYNPALIKAGYYLAAAGIVDEVAKLFLPKPPKMEMRQDVEYVGTVEPRRIFYGARRVGARAESFERPAS